MKRFFEAWVRRIVRSEQIEASAVRLSDESLRTLAQKVGRASRMSLGVGIVDVPEGGTDRGLVGDSQVDAIAGPRVGGVELEHLTFAELLDLLDDVVASLVGKFDLLAVDGNEHHDLSPSGVGSAAVTADASTDTVGDAPGTSAPSGGVSGAPPS